MKSQKVTKLLVAAIKNNKKILLVGAPGIGKSDIITNAAKEAGAELIIMHPAVSDPTDYKGMPAIVEKGSNTLAEFLPFGDLRQLMEAKTKTVCFIDDIGQAPASVQAALMQLILAREINGKKISDLVVFQGATNDVTHMAGVTPILEPVKSRWNSIVHLEVDADGWVEWAMGNNIPAELVAFIKYRPALLNKFEPTTELRNSPSPRNVVSLAGWLEIGVTNTEVWEGCVGAGFTAEFTAFRSVWKKMPDIENIIANPTTAPVPKSEPSILYAVTTALSYRVDADNFDAIVQYIDRLPKEFGVMTMKDCINRNLELTSTRTYINWATANHKIIA